MDSVPEFGILYLSLPTLLSHFWFNSYRTVVRSGDAFDSGNSVNRPVRFSGLFLLGDPASSVKSNSSDPASSPARRTFGTLGGIRRQGSDRERRTMVLPRRGGVGRDRRAAQADALPALQDGRHAHPPRRSHRLR